MDMTFCEYSLANDRVPEDAWVEQELILPNPKQAQPQTEENTALGTPEFFSHGNHADVHQGAGRKG